MTFEEAIAIAIKSKEKWGGGSSEAWLVNALSALGVLKIDEPKSAFDKFRAAMSELNYNDISCVWRDIPNALESAGLKIVECSPQETTVNSSSPDASAPAQRPRE